MKQAWIAIAFGLSVLTAACAEYGGRPGMQPGRGSASDEATLDDTTNGFAASAVRSELAARTKGADARDGDTQAPATRERMLIQRGDLRVEVARPEDTAREWLAKVKEWGGFLQAQTKNVLTVRLPAARFDEAFAATRALGRVLEESRQANDVTEEFLDLGIRLDTAKKARERLLEVLKRAEKVEEVLKVEAELRRLTEEIERMEGRQKFLTDQVALATLSLSLQATTAPPPPKPKGRQWSRFGWINRVGAESMTEAF